MTEMLHRIRWDNLATESIALALLSGPQECQRETSRHWADLDVVHVLVLACAGSGRMVIRQEDAKIRTAGNVQDSWNLKKLVNLFDLTGSAPLSDCRKVMAEVERRRLLMSCQRGPFIDMIACGSHVCGSVEVLKMVLKLIPPDILELICSPAILSKSQKRGCCHDVLLRSRMKVLINHESRWD